MTEEEQKYRVVLSGQLVDGFDRDQVEQALGQLLKIPLDRVQRLLNGERSRLSKDFSLEQAERLREKLVSRGAECQVEPIRAKRQKPATVNPESGAAQVPVSSVEAPEAPPVSAEAHSSADESLELELPAGPAPSTADAEAALDLDLDLPEPSGADIASAAEEVVLDSNDVTGQAAFGLATAGQSPVNPPAGADAVSSDPPQAEDSGVVQFFEQPTTAAAKTRPAAGKSKKTNPLLYAGLGLVLLGAAVWFALPLFSTPASDPVAETVAAQPPAPPKDPQLAQSEARIDALSRSVKVWMIQFGSGFNPQQATLERLASDLSLNPQEMVDGWGTPLRYEPAQAHYRVISAGADRQFGTVDDLTKQVDMQ